MADDLELLARLCDLGSAVVQHGHRNGAEPHFRRNPRVFDPEAVHTARLFASRLSAVPPLATERVDRIALWNVQQSRAEPLALRDPKRFGPPTDQTSRGVPPSPYQVHEPPRRVRLEQREAILSIARRRPMRVYRRGARDTGGRNPGALSSVGVAKDSPLDFGLLIAYLLPGFALLQGVRPLVPGLDALLGAPAEEAATIGGFLYTTLAAVGAGMVVSTVRWMVIDALHHATGLRPPDWDFSLLGKNAAAFDLIVEHYYRYYQAYANGVVSLFIVFAVRRWSVGIAAPLGALDFGLLGLTAVLFVGSRDALRRYYTRGGQLLRQPPARATGTNRRRASRSS